MQLRGSNQNHVCEGKSVGVPDFGLHLSLSLKHCDPQLPHHAHQNQCDLIPIKSLIQEGFQVGD